MLHYNKLLPSAHIAELFFPLMKDEKQVLNVVDRITDIEFYRGIELGIILDKSIANQIRNIAEKKQLMVTQWMTFELLKDDLNLASTDKALRNKSVSRAKELVHLSAESGTSKLSMVSGNAPAEHLRDDAKKCLADSIIAISQEAKQFKNMNLQIEPLDRFAHKKQLIGFTGETVEWIINMRNECSNLYLAWDSAHVALNEENLVESLKLAAPVISQIHLANAVLNPMDALYGDYHIPIGTPGFLNEAVAVTIIETALTLDIPKIWQGIPIAIEMRTNENDDLWQNETLCRHFLQTALQKAVS